MNISQPKLWSEKFDDDDDDNNNNNKYQHQPEAGVQDILSHDLKTSSYTTRHDTTAIQRLLSNLRFQSKFRYTEGHDTYWQ